jgi:hypothetical protein
MDQIQVYKEMIHAGIIVIDEAREELWYETFNTEFSTQPLITKNVTLLQDVWLSEIDMQWS